MANRSWSSLTIWKGFTRFAIGTNHQPIDQRGVTDGLPPPSTGTLSTVRLSQAKYEIADSSWAPSEPKTTSAVDRSKLLASFGRSIPARASWTRSAPDPSWIMARSVMNPTIPSRMQVILARLPALRYTAEKPFSASAGAARGAAAVQVCIYRATTTSRRSIATVANRRIKDFILGDPAWPRGSGPSAYAPNSME